MLCRRCSYRIFNPLKPINSRTISTSSIRLLPDSPPAATSSSAGERFSTPLIPSTSNTPNLPTGATPAKSPTPPKSSLPAGAPLRLTYLKNADAALAREDGAYPPWLWTLLDPSSKSASANSSAGNEGDAFAKSKKQRRTAAKAARAKGMNPHANKHTVTVPLHEQSIDLPVGGREGTAARDELGASMRDARRRKIKEQNFLKGMR